MKEFWNEEITRKSWNTLKELNKKFSFVVIGGWAVYLWTKAYKSKDIDIVVNFDELEKLKKEFDVEKNERLKKFEIKQDFFDIDIYVPFYSNLIFPLERLLKEYKVVEGFKVPSMEVLLVLKQQALKERKGIKAKKDAYDIMLLLIKGINLKKYVKVIKEIKKPELLEMLIKTVSGINVKDHDYFRLSFKEFAKIKKKLVKELKELRSLLKNKRKKLE